MLSGQRHERVDGAVEIGQQRVDRGAQLEHERGIDNVLAGGAPVHVARGLGVGLGDFGGQCLDERNGHSGGLDRLLAERRDVITLGVRGFRDRIDAGCRDHPDGGLGARQRHLDIEHVLQPRAIIEDGTHRRARHQRRQQRGRGRRIGHR